MSCERDEEVRIIMKYSTISGAEPTIPTSGDHSDGTWLPTDLYTGELFLNSADDKLWIRTDNGIVGIGGTAGATFSGIYDYVHISGGTYSGEVYAPTFSSIGIVAQNIYGDTFEGTAGASASFTGNFFGDGSGLTGIIADWLGGTVSTPVHFVDTVDFTNDIHIDGAIYSNNPNIAINSSLEISGGVSASIFYGDGSGLTNLPTGTYSDTYTATATLSGNEIIFTRNDASDYSVDLTPILGSQSLAMVQWDDTTDVLTLYLNDGTEMGIVINNFSQLSSTGAITAPEFYGGSFYGTLVGTFSGDIYTTTATLYGTELVFDRINGSSYSVDLSSISATGSGGGTGTQSLAETLANGNATGGYNINLNVTDQIVSDDNKKAISLEEDRALIQYENSFTSEGVIYTQIGTLEVKEGTNMSQLIHSTSDDMSGMTKIGAVRVIDRGATIIADNPITGNQAFIMTDSGTGLFPVPEIRFYADDQYGNISWMKIKPGLMQISGFNNDGFQGLQYMGDYSADYSIRSLVDKEYVDNAISTGGGGTLEQTLQAGNTTGTQSIYISSSASQIIGYNGVSQHWYDATNPVLGNYYRIENGTGASSSYIQIEDNTRGNIRIANDNLYDTTSSYSERTSVVVGQSDIQHNATTRDYAGGTVWGSTNQTIYMNGSDMVTRDYIANTTAWIATYTGGAETYAYLYADRGGNGASFSSIKVNHDKITSLAQNGITDYTQIDQTPTGILVEGFGGAFKGIEYAADYSATLTNRSLVDKQYVDGAVVSAVGGTATATMFNSKATHADFGALPWYKLNTPAISFSTANYTLSANQISYSPINLVTGETINEVAIFCSTLLAGATASIALYSASLDINGRHYPSTLLTTFGDVSLATTGRKTITGLNYIIPASLNGIYYTAILRTGPAGTPTITGPANTGSIVYYGSLNGTTMDRPMTARPSVAFSSFPATITSASFSTYTSSTTLPYIGFR